MSSVTVRRRQSLYDIALQYCGSAMAAVEIAQLNDIPVHEDLLPGQALEIPSVYDRKVVRKYRVSGIAPTTGSVDELSSEGINYMGIEIDFIIQ